MMRSITSRNDRATAAYTTSSGETIRIRIAAQPPPASGTKGICTSNINKTTSSKSFMKVSKFTKRRLTAGASTTAAGPDPKETSTSTSTRTASRSSRPPMERVDSLDLISLQKIPEDGNVRLSDLFLSSLSQHRLHQGDNHESHRSTGTATTAASDFTSSTKSLQSMPDINASASFRGGITNNGAVESTTSTTTTSNRKLPPLRKGGSLCLLRATTLSSSSPAIAAAYDTDLDRSNASCPCDLGHMHSVHFGRVEILEFRRAIGDNPSCASGGPPLQLGGLQSSQSIDLDDYEIHRTMNRRKREQMMVPPHMREIWLRDAGYGSAQINESIRRASVIKRQRQKSIQTSTVVHELSQRFINVTRFMKKAHQRRRDRSKHAASVGEDDDADNTEKIEPLDDSSSRRRQEELSDELDQKRFVDALAA